MPTPTELDTLKLNWSSDPCWDIEDTEGFEAHRDELLAYRKQKEAQWEQERTARLELLATRMGCPGNRKLAAYIEGLEERIKRLESSGDLDESTRIWGTH